MLLKKSRKKEIMYEIFADLHIHIGRSENNKPIKITAARSLNFANIAKECFERKGINIVGIIDCASPYVIEDIENFLKTGEAYEIEDGGIIYKDKVCIILGSEIETSVVGVMENVGVPTIFKRKMWECPQYLLFPIFERDKEFFKRNAKSYKKYNLKFTKSKYFCL